MNGKVILQPIKALKLGPTDTLIIHFPKEPTAEQMANLNEQIKRENWTIKFMVIYGPFQVGAVKPSQHD